MNLCILFDHAIVQVSLGSFRVFVDVFFQHLFRLVVHPLSFRRSVFGTATVFSVAMD